MANPGYYRPSEQYQDKVVSTKAPNRTSNSTSTQQPPDWYNQPPSWYNNAPQAAAPQTGGAAVGGAPQAPWGPNANGWNGTNMPPGGSLISQVQGMYGIDLATRYTTGNVIRIKDGRFYRVVGLADQVAKKETKGLTKVKGRDGKYYYMKKLSDKEAKNVGKAPTPSPTAQANANPNARFMEGRPGNPPGWQSPGNWWTMDWWNQPGMYKRMY